MSKTTHPCSAMRAGSGEPALIARSGGSEAAFVRIDDTEAFDGPEATVFGLADVHIHPHVVLPPAPSPPGPPGPSAIRAWSRAAVTASCSREPASFTAACQSRSPR